MKLYPLVLLPFCFLITACGDQAKRDSGSSTQGHSTKSSVRTSAKATPKHQAEHAKPPAAAVSQEQLDVLLLDSTPAAQKELKDYIIQLLRTNPSLALEIFQKLPPGSRRWETLSDMSWQLDKRSGVALLSFLATSPEKNEVDFFDRCVGRVASQMSFDELQALRHSFGEKKRAKMAAEIASKAINSFGKEQALAMTAADPELNRNVLGCIAVKEPSFFLDATRLDARFREDPELMGELLSSLANKNPKEGGEFVLALGNPEWTEMFVNDRMGIDSQAVSAWIAGLPSGDVKTAAIKAMLRRMSREQDPEAYDAWAKLLPEAVTQ